MYQADLEDGSVLISNTGLEKVIISHKHCVLEVSINCKSSKGSQNFNRVYTVDSTIVVIANSLCRITSELN